MAINPQRSAAVLQSAIGSTGSGDSNSQLFVALASTIQQKAVQSASLQQQLQQFEHKLLLATARDTTSSMSVDTKTLGRVENLRGARKAWPDWSFSFRTFRGGVDSKAAVAPR